jgi:sporulation protein YlmC with PRC-barrel domain
MKWPLGAAALAAAVAFGGGRALGQSESAAGATHPADYRASALLGTQVTTPRGEPLGWIEGLLLDVGPGGIHYAVLTVGADEAKKRFAYPLNAFRPGGSLLTLNVQPERLADAPGYGNHSWPAPEHRTGARYVRAARVIGGGIIDPLGNLVGDVTDIVLNVETGHTRYYLVDFEEGGRFPLAPHAVRLSPDRPPTIKADSHRRS